MTISPIPAHARLRLNQEGLSVKLAIVKVAVTKVPCGNVTAGDLLKRTK